MRISYAYAWQTSLALIIYRETHGSRSVELSEAGQSILPQVREVLRAARLLEDSLQEVNSQVGGEPKIYLFLHPIP